MKSNKLIILSLVTIVVVLAATMMSRHRAPSTSLQKQPLFPDLLEKVNDIASVSLSKQGKTLTLVREDKQWLIQQSDNYPANFGKIRETVIAVAELRILAEKTGNPKRYKRLGVEDPATEGASSLLLSLFDTGGDALASLIVGKPRHSKSAGDKPGLYVRLPDTQTALLVEGRLDVSATAMDWFERNLFSIHADRIKHIHIAHADGSSVDLGRENSVDDFTVDNLPAGMEMQSNVVISRMGTMLENIFVDNVINADKLTGIEQTVTTVRTFDGLIVSIVSAEIDGVNYSGFGFSVDEKALPPPADENTEEEATASSGKPDPVEEANTLNKTLSGWAYAIPEFKYELFTRKLEQLSRKAGSEDKKSNDDK